MTELQKANLWKRMTAGLFDSILTAILAVGFGFLLSLLLHFGSYSDALEAGYAKYEAQYGVTFELTQEEFAVQTQQEQAQYNAAYEALIQDKEVLYNYNMTVNLTLVITALGILLAILVMEFAFPLVFGNGQTLGKKVFGLCLVRTDGVQMNNLQLFTRTLLGKYTLETMIPVNILLMVFLGLMDVFGTAVLLALLVGQCICWCATRTHSLLHDLLCGTAVVDFHSQRIFTSTQELIDYQKELAAERARRADY